MSTPKCRCGLYAVGECVSCDEPLCADHGSISQGRFFCADHLAAAELEEARRAIDAEARRAERRAAAAERRLASEERARRVEELRFGLGLRVAAVGVSDAVLAAWAELDLDDDPLEALLANFSFWAGSGISPSAAAPWIDAYMQTVEVRAEWARSGFSATDVWGCLHLVSGPAELRRWTDAGVTVIDAVEFLQAGVDLKSAIGWVEAEGNWRSGESRRWRRTGMDFATADAWRAAGFRSGEARAWLEDGFALSRAEQYRAMGLTPQEVRRRINDVQ